MKKFAKQFNGRIFDVAAGPMYLIIFGIPALVVIAVVGLIFVVVKLIKRARKNNIETENQQNSDSSSDNLK